MTNCQPQISSYANSRYLFFDLHKARSQTSYSRTSSEKGEGGGGGRGYLVKQTINYNHYFFILRFNVACIT